MKNHITENLNISASNEANSKCFIERGFTLWARQSCDSNIFLEKPDHWFKVWFYIVTKVNYKDNGKFKRGQGFFTYEELATALIPKRSVDVIDKIMRYLRTDGAVTSKRTVRGFIVTVNNYDKYQDIKNYTDGGQTVRRRLVDGTIHKELKKERIKEYNTLESITDKELDEVSKEYGVSFNSVKKVYEELVLYCGSTGKKYANYKMTLMAWVRRRMEEKGLNRSKELRPDQIEDIRLNPEKLFIYKTGGYDVSRLTFK